MLWCILPKNRLICLLPWMLLKSPTRDGSSIHQSTQTPSALPNVVIMANAPVTFYEWEAMSNSGRLSADNDELLFTSLFLWLCTPWWKRDPLGLCLPLREKVMFICVSMNLLFSNQHPKFLNISRIKHAIWWLWKVLVSCKWDTLSWKYCK